MQKIMEHLFDEYNSGQSRYTEELHRIATNRGMLKKDLNKWQRKMLPSIIDDENLIAEKWAVDSFSEGVRCGVMFMFEIFRAEMGSAPAR